MEILSLAIAQADDVTVSLCIDPARTGSGIFEGLLATRRALKSAAAKAGVPVTEEQLTESKRFRSHQSLISARGCLPQRPKNTPPTRGRYAVTGWTMRLTKRRSRRLRSDGWCGRKATGMRISRCWPGIWGHAQRQSRRRLTGTGLPLFIDGGRTVEANAADTVCPSAADAGAKAARPGKKG